MDALSLADQLLVNVAKGKPASQSSLSQWSAGADEASRAVSGSVPSSFAFHTAMEDRPWWQVDLLCIYPIDSIVVHNRLDRCWERAKTLKVEISEDSKHWVVVHAGIEYFLGGEKGRPLELPLGGAVCARYVKLSLVERQQPLHLAQVEVFVRGKAFSITNFGNNHGISEPSLRLLLREYSVSGDAALPIVGLDMRPIVGVVGRIGNLLMQYTIAILLAEKTGLKYIKVAQHEFCDFSAPISVGSVTYLPSDAPLPAEGAFLAGGFFEIAGASGFSPIVNTIWEPDEIECSRVAREVIRPHLLTRLSFSRESHFDDELTIHIRSGDLFAGHIQNSGSGYRQPPLAFYTIVVNKLFIQGTIRRVQLVYEDRGNPCVDALEEFLVHRGIEFRSQSGTLAADLSALVDASHLVFGFGTFGYAVCRLSTRIKSVHFFAPELCGHYALIPSIERVSKVVDREGRYIQPFLPVWHNTAEQRELMCTYPAEALEIEELKPLEGRTE